MSCFNPPEGICCADSHGNADPWHRNASVSIPLRGFVVLTDPRRLFGCDRGNVSIPLRGFVVLTVLTQSTDSEVLLVSIPLRGFVVLTALTLTRHVPNQKPCFNPPEGICCADRQAHRALWHQATVSFNPPEGICCADSPARAGSEPVTARFNPPEGICCADS